MENLTTNTVENTVENQLTFLNNFVTVWETCNARENYEMEGSGSKTEEALNCLYAAFLDIAGLPHWSADELIAAIKDTTSKWDVFSPDGLPIEFNTLYDTPQQAMAAAKEWSKRYEIQGYYSSPKYDRIALKDLLSYCKFDRVDAPEKEKADENETAAPEIPQATLQDLTAGDLWNLKFIDEGYSEEDQPEIKAILIFTHTIKCKWYIAITDNPKGIFRFYDGLDNFYTNNLDKAVEWLNKFIRDNW